MQRQSIGCLMIGSLLVFACAGCGASGTSNTGGPLDRTSDAGLSAGGDTAPSRCTVNLTGAVTTTIPCSRAYVVWSKGTETSTLIMDGIEPNFDHDFNVSIGLPDKPELKTYTNSDPDATKNGYLRVMENLLRWEAHGGPAGPGNYSVTLTALGPETPGEFDIRWHEIHGSLQATLVAAGSNGETGTIAFTVTF